MRFFASAWRSGEFPGRSSASNVYQSGVCTVFSLWCSARRGFVGRAGLVRGHGHGILLLAGGTFTLTAFSTGLDGVNFFLRGKKSV